MSLSLQDVGVMRDNEIRAGVDSVFEFSHDRQRRLLGVLQSAVMLQDGGRQRRHALEVLAEGRDTAQRGPALVTLGCLRRRKGSGPADVAQERVGLAEYVGLERRTRGHFVDTGSGGAKADFLNDVQRALDTVVRIIVGVVITESDVIETGVGEYASQHR